MLTSTGTASANASRGWLRANGLWLIAGTVAVAAVGFTAMRVYLEHASLDWDDTEYIELALRWNHSIEQGERPVNTGVRPPFLSLWLLLGTQFFGGAHLEPLLWWGTIPALCLTLILVLAVCGFLGGPGAALAGVAVTIASPLVIHFGGRVMAETFLAFWVLGATATGAMVVTQPRVWVALAFGCTVGIALTAKLSAGVMLLPSCLYVLWQVLANPTDLGKKIRVLSGTLAGTTICAGPFYFRGYRPILEHASYSARFDEVGLGISDTTHFAQRILAGFVETFGSATLIGIAVGIVCMVLHHRSSGKAPRTAADAKIHFCRMSLWNVIFTAVFVAIQPYYDTRFFMPVAPLAAAWFALAVSPLCTTRSLRLTLMVHGCIAAGMMMSIWVNWPRNKTREPSYWSETLDLLKTLSTAHGIKSLANVGNCARWNTSKLKMISRLAPGGLELEFHEVVRLPESEAVRRMQLSDAIVVLSHSEIPPEFLKSAPAQNLSYDSCVGSIPSQFKELDLQLLDRFSLPDIRIYVRQGGLEQYR